MNRLASITLGILLLFCTSMGAMILCMWLAPVIVAFLHGGWRDVASIPVKQRAFPGTPTWLSQTAAELMAGVNIFAGFWGFVAAMAGAGRLWRRLVVDKLRWMTAAEFDEMLKRDPGF